MGWSRGQMEPDGTDALAIAKIEESGFGLGIGIRRWRTLSGEREVSIAWAELDRFESDVGRCPGNCRTMPLAAQSRHSILGHHTPPPFMSARRYSWGCSSVHQLRRNRFRCTGNLGGTNGAGTSPSTPGALVKLIVSSRPARQAGLQPGDLIVALDGHSHLCRFVHERDGA